MGNPRKNPLPGLIQTLGNLFWRLQNIYKIRTKDSRNSRLLFNPHQKQISSFIKSRLDNNEPIRLFNLKARQVGLTTFYALFYLDYAIFHKNRHVAILAHSRESLGYIWRIVRYAHASMPDSLRPRLLDDSKIMMSFPNGSSMFVSLAIRSIALHGLHISEYAFCDEEEIQASLAACAPDACITFETTANGMNHAELTYREMKESGSAIFHPWFLSSEYNLESDKPMDAIGITDDEKTFCRLANISYGIKIDTGQILYRRQMRAGLKNMAPQEMAEDDISCFLVSGNPYFDINKMATLLRNAEKHLAEQPAQKGDCWEMWEAPDSTHKYVAGADVAKGLSVGGENGRDYSVLAVICITCRKQAFRYRSRVPMSHFYRICNEWGLAYNKALLAIEDNIGDAVIQGLVENCRYPNLYKEEVSSGFTKISHGISERQKETKYGWHTSASSKVIMLSQLSEAIQGKFEDNEENFKSELLVLDRQFLEECFKFKNRDGKLSAEAGYHDDLVIAWAIAWQMAIRNMIMAPNAYPGGIFRIGRKMESADIKWGK